MAHSFRSWALIALFIGVSVCSGCIGPIATLLYVFNGEGDVKAEYAGLKEKKVAVVCLTTTSLSINDLQVTKKLAKQISTLLKTNGKKIDVISSRDVEKWMDENNSEDYVAIGKGLKADMVVAIDLHGFKLYQGSTLYRGQVNCALAVYDIKASGEKVWERQMPKTLFPATVDVPTHDVTESDFRNKFVERLSHLIARNFYNYPLSEDFARNSFE